MMKAVNSLYIHYPYCKHLCHYCDFYKHLYNNESSQDFLKYMGKSLKQLKDYLDVKGFKLQNLETLYFGGGTPSLLGSSLPKSIDGIHEYFGTSFKDNYEFTLEVDPGAYHDKKVLEDLLSYGVNRLSIGVQSLDPVVHKYLDRSHEMEEIYKLMEVTSSLNINFSVDFIIGVVDDEVHKRSIISELQEILKFNPNHISLYILTVNKSYKYFDILPNDEQVAREFQLVHNFLESKGFCHYEVSNYARKGFESKHNWKYWNQESYVALGPSSTGLLVDQDVGSRFSWKPSGEIATEGLNLEQLRIEKIYTGGRTKKGISLDLLSDVAKRSLPLTFGSVKEKHFVVEPHNWIILDSIIKELL